MPDQLADMPELPELCEHVWTYFVELHGERPGDAKITSSGIMDWQQIEGIRLKRWEIRAIRLIDNTWMQSRAKNV